MCINICSTNIYNIYPLKVRADTSLSVGEWSDPVIVTVNLTSSSEPSESDSSLSPVAYIVPSVIVGIVLIIMAILIIIYIVHCYKNRIKYDTYVSRSTLFILNYIYFTSLHINYLCL